MKDGQHSSMALQTNDLCFSFGKRAVLNNVNLAVPAGSIFGFLGPNGAGKSTTIKTLQGLLSVKPGMIHVFGKELNTNLLHILEHTGSTIESPSLYDHLSARKNLEITQRLRKLPASRIDEVLEIAGLYAEAGRPVRQFSTGMKQRLSLALALLGKPELLILDEPINGLDPEGIREIRNLLVKLNHEEGCTIFLSSHILDEVEKICDHVAVIHQGNIVYHGSTQAMRQKNLKEETLVLETSDNLKLAGLFPAGRTIASGSTISIACDSKEAASQVIRIAVESGIDVYSARPELHRLEESFFDLLKEGDAS